MGEESFEVLRDLFLDEIRARHLSYSYHWQTRHALGILFSKLRQAGIDDVRDVSEEHLVEHARYLQEKTTRRGTILSASARSVSLGRVRAFFAFLERRGVILRNPALNVPLPSRDPTPKDVLTVAEARRLMLAPCGWTIVGRRDRAILETLYGTGIRAGECVRADIDDLDLEQRTLLVRNGKGHKDRLVPIPARAFKAVIEYLRESRPELVRQGQERALFVSNAGRRLQVPAMRYMLRRRCEDAGVRRVHPHLLRHSYATHLLQGGADVRHVQELLGHAQIATTATYTRVAVGDLSDVIGRSHPRERQRRR